ncbi:MAG: DNA-binding response regulator, partial [Chloroflexi bacterium]
MNKTTILIVEDEPKIVRLVREVLIATGYSVLSTGDGEEAVSLVAIEQPDLILLDIVLTSELDGYGVAQRIRAFSDVPIIMLTAKVQEADLLQGFDAGADDYITKPFSSKELLVRIRAVLKRVVRENSELGAADIVCGPVCIDLARRRAIVNGEPVHLTRTEYNLLYELATHRNQVMV